MYKLSFKVKHKECAETDLSIKYPAHHITVVDIQSTHPKEKQYFYYITGDSAKFDGIISYLKKSKAYKLAKEVERSENTLLLLVVLCQKGYVQNIIQKYHGFFIDLHTVSGGYEYWHIGVVEKDSIEGMLKDLKTMGKLKILYVGKVDFANVLLSKQQKKVFSCAYEKRYYEIPRKTTVAKIARLLALSPATVGEHLLKAENKLLHSIAKKL
ncbi:MAG: helix-turn-helix domain-containing protein [Candidatus Woesearchaeota archaeon]|nr:helix-turn-helix domain-containing protein [Candidatus Woesearchaeota archaeon]